MVCFPEYIFSKFIVVVSYLTDQCFILLKSWPFVLLLIVFLFRKELKLLFLNLKSAKIGNAKIILKQGNPDANGLVKQNPLLQEAQTTEKNKKTELPPFPPGVFKEVMDEREKQLKEWISKFPYKENDSLIRELASFQLAVEYERIYHLIFKSQIDLLQRLEGMKDTLSREEAMEYYKESKKKYPQAYFNFTFDNWLAFLTTSSLVLEEKSFLKITNNGRAFLTYIIVQRQYDITLKSL